MNPQDKRPCSQLCCRRRMFPRTCALRVRIGAPRRQWCPGECLLCSQDRLQQGSFWSVFTKLALNLYSLTEVYQKTVVDLCGGEVVNQFDLVLLNKILHRLYFDYQFLRQP